MEKKELKKYIIISFLVIAVCFVVKNFALFGKLFTLAYNAVFPLLLGAVIAYIFNIILSVFEKRYFPKSDNKAVAITRRPLCILLSFLCAVGIIILVLNIVIPEIIHAIKLMSAKIPPLLEAGKTQIISKLDQYPDLQKQAVDLFNEFDVKSLDWASITSKAAKLIRSGFMGLINSAVDIVGSFAGTVTNIVLAVIFAIYLLSRKDKLRTDIARIQKIFINEKHSFKINRIFRTADETFKSFFIGQFVEAIILGCFCFIGMKILQLPYAAMSGTLVGVTALIPIVGAFIGAGVSAFIIFTESPMQSLIFLVFLLILQQIEGNLIYPKVVGDSIGLPGIWVLAAVTVGGGLWGITGMLVGVPLAATVYKLIFIHLEEKESALGIKKTEEKNNSDDKDTEKSESAGQKQTNPVKQIVNKGRRKKSKKK